MVVNALSCWLQVTAVVVPEIVTDAAVFAHVPVPLNLKTCPFEVSWPAAFSAWVVSCA